MADIQELFQNYCFPEVLLRNEFKVALSINYLLSSYSTLAVGMFNLAIVKLE